MTTTLVPLVTPQQQMALAWYGFSLPEGKAIKGGARVWAIKVDGPRIQWIEAMGLDTNIAVEKLVDVLAQR